MLKKVGTIVFIFICAMIMSAYVQADIKSNKIKPVILSPENNEKIYAGDSLALRYYAKKDEDCYVILSDEKGTVFTEKAKSGDLLRNGGKDGYVVGRGGVYLLPPDILEPQKRYSIQIVCDFAASDPVYFDTVSGGEEVIEEILKKHEAKKSLFSQSTEELFNETVLSPFLQEDIYKANLETIAPKEFFSSASLSKQMMENINIDVWKLDDYGKRYASTMTFCSCISHKKRGLL